MIISDLSYIETVNEASNIEGGKKGWKKGWNKVHQSNYSEIYQWGKAEANAVSMGDYSPATANAYVYNTATVTQSNEI